MDRLSCVVLVGLDRTAKFTEALQNSLTPRMRAPTLWGLWMLAWGVGGTNAEIFNLRGLDPLYRAPLSLDDTEVTTGTTMVAARYKNGVIIGADSRSVKGGAYVSDRFTEKVVRVSDYVCLACSGKSAVAQRLGDELATRLRTLKISHNKEPTSRNAAAVLRSLIRDGHIAGQSLGMETDAITASYSTEAGPSIHQIMAGGTIVESGDYAVAGSGARYVVGYLDSHYPDGSWANLSKDECTSLLTKALALAVERDNMSGGPVVLCHIDGKGVERQVLTPAQLRAAVEPPSGSRIKP